MKKFLILFVVLAAAAWVVTRAPSVDEKEFARNATRIAGHVIDKEEQADDKGQKIYWVTYTYNDSKGTTHSTRALVDDAELWKRLRKGQVEMVYYDQNNPGRSYLAVVLEKRLGHIPSRK